MDAKINRSDDFQLFHDLENVAVIGELKFPIRVTFKVLCLMKYEAHSLAKKFIVKIFQKLSWNYIRLLH